MNRHALDVLQFPAVLDAVAQRATSALGGEAVRALEPQTDRGWLEAELDRVDAMMAFRSRSEGWAFPPIPDVRVELKRLVKPGSLWDGPTLLAGARLLRSSSATRDALKRHEDELPPLRPLLDRLLELDERAKSIEKAIDDGGEVTDQASPSLARVRRELRAQRSTIVERLERYVASLPESLRVEDASVTVREGRYVIPVRRAGRKKVGGIVHDESATGATLFVEPPLALDLMNRVRELEIAEAREVRRILQELTDSLRPHAEEMRGALDALVSLDSLFARARYALEHDARRPTLTDDVRDYAVVFGRHPLLLEGGADVVPFALALEPDERTLVVSGPNTGGKTVLLKSLGLVSLMTQAGMVPPVGDGTRLPLFGDVFADIGDEQSIEASLSTFSAHLANLREIVADADGDALVLIDEIGSGTDPMEGAALARAILVELTRRGTLTVASSHLGQLKLLAGEVPGVVNASLQFDSRALEPTYRLQKGVPGRSYGLAIARRLGFRENVLEEAEALIPKDERDVSQLLSELEAKETELAEAVSRAERERDAAAEARADADRLREELDTRRREVSRREEDAERRARQQARDLLLNARQEVEAAIAELRAVVEKGEGMAAFDEAATAARRRVERAASRQAERAPDRPQQEVEAPSLEPGMAVRIAATGAEGTVVEVRDDRATVETGGLRLDVKAADLEPVSGSGSEGRGDAGRQAVRDREARRGSRWGGGWSGPRPEASPEVHLRGLRADEVAGTLMPALDSAIQAGLGSLRIIHGKGTGVLREVVAELLDRDPRVKGFRSGRLNEGGSGVTVAELE
jgi:DNA mismatch repair protein MutS2